MGMGILERSTYFLMNRVELQSEHQKTSKYFYMPFLDKVTFVGSAEMTREQNLLRS